MLAGPPLIMKSSTEALAGAAAIAQDAASASIKVLALIELFFLILVREKPPRRAARITRWYLRSGHPELRCGPLLAIGREADPGEAQQHHCPSGGLRHGGCYRQLAKIVEGESAVDKLVIG
jgi:hypothetical protein